MVTLLRVITVADEGGSRLSCQFQWLAPEDQVAGQLGALQLGADEWKCGRSGLCSRTSTQTQLCNKLPGDHHLVDLPHRLPCSIFHV